MDDFADNGNSVAPRTVRFKTFYWKYEDTEEGELEINIAGRTADNKSVHCIVKNFTPFVYLELPKRIKWNKAKCVAVFEYFKKVMKSNGPLQMWTIKKYKTKYKKLVNTMRMTFLTQKAAASLGSRCRNSRNGFAIDGVGFFKAGEFQVHETNIDPIIKYTASKELKTASWIEAKESINPEEKELSIEDRKYSTADIDLYVDWLDICGWEPEKLIVVRPRYFSLDIECYSINHNSKLPDPEIPGNFIFQIAITEGYLGDPNFKKILLTLFNPHDIKDVKMVRVALEKELLLKLLDFINKVNPDIFITYNGMKFDWGYLIKRAELCGVYHKFAQNTRILGRRADLMETSWSSSAYGEQKFRYLDPMGRTNLDVLLEVERNYRLPQYGLNPVSEFFLKEHKDDITARQLFMLVQLTMEMTPLVKDLPKGNVVKSRRIELKRKIQKILPMRRCHGVVKKLRKSLMDANTGKDFRYLVREALTITGRYNVQDTILPVRIAEKLNLWTTMEETSNCQGIPMSYLHTRGQQVRVVAQFFRKTLFRDLIIPYKEKLKEGERVRYEGAIVIEANPGDYDNVICTDFASLYPSMIIAYNICYTTLVEADDPIPDSKCNVLKISSHIGCGHDPKKRKKKKDEILCHDRTYRFKKVIFHPDGTREGEGLMPELERTLLAERKVKKKEMAKLEAKLKMAQGFAEPEDLAYYKKMGWEIVEKGCLTEDQLEILKVSISVLNAQQLAIKVSCNSMYGTLGAQNGPMPLVEGAEAVTAMGRKSIEDAIDFILKRFPEARLVYGDSVVPDTPIIVRENGIINFYRVEDIPRKSCWASFGEKEYANPKEGLEVWSDKGFTPLKSIMRHKTNKKIYRVLTHTGVVDVTEDHSLLTPEGDEVAPKHVKVGDKLLHHDLPEIIKFDLVDSLVPQPLVWRVESEGNFKTEDKLEAAEKFMEYVRNGHKPSIINKDNQYEIVKDFEVEDPTKIKKIVDLGRSNDYVYDLETENHHFAAGIGKMVVHNTDSAMITFVGKTTEESFRLGDEVADVATHYLITKLLEIEEDYSIFCPSEDKTYRIDKYPRSKIDELSDDEKIMIYRYDGCPIKLEFENLYQRYVLLSKKRYVAYAVNRAGKIVAKIKKGVVLARRDNCMYLRDSYKMLTDGILDRLPKSDIMGVLYDQIHKLFTRQVPSANLILYMGVKTIMNYAKKKEEKRGGAVVSRVFLDIDLQPIDDPIGPLDPRLVYPNLPQVLLALKMLRRGDDVPPNTRLEFLYLKTPGAIHQGEKAEDYTFYKENKDVLDLKPDYLHYIEKQLARPITELLNVKYRPTKIPYEKLEDSLLRLIEELDEMLRYKVKEVKTYAKKVKSKHDDEKVGWCVYQSSSKRNGAIGCKKCYSYDKKERGKLCSKHKSGCTFREYKYKGKNAQVQFILDSMGKKRVNPKAKGEICPEKYKELYNVALRWKSKAVLDKIYSEHGLRKRATRRPTQTGEKLRIKTKDEFNTVFLTKKVRKYPKGSMATLLDITENVSDTSAKKKRYYTYKIEMPDKKIIENVPRSSITTWYHKDGKLMKEVLLARRYYMSVVEQLKEIFCPFVYQGAEKDDFDYTMLEDDDSY